MLFPVPVQIRQSNVTGGTRFLSGFAPRFALGVQNVRTYLGILAHSVNVSLYQRLSFFTRHGT
jgi:hypothetical protein